MTKRNSRALSALLRTALPRRFAVTTPNVSQFPILQLQQQIASAVTLL